MPNPLAAIGGGVTSNVSSYPFSGTQQQQQKINPTGTSSPGVRTPINLPNPPAIGAGVGVTNTAPFQLLQQRDALMSRFYLICKKKV